MAGFGKKASVHVSYVLTRLLVFRTGATGKLPDSVNIRVLSTLWTLVQSEVAVSVLSLPRKQPSEQWQINTLHDDVFEKKIS